MAQHIGSSRVGSSSGEYVTNWSSLAIAAAVVAVAVGVLVLPRLAPDAPRAAREPGSTDQNAAAQVISAAENESDRGRTKPLALRATFMADEAPIFDARDHYAWYGPSARTIADGLGASASATATHIQTRRSLALSPMIVALRSDVIAALYDRPLARQQRSQWQSRTEDELREYLANEVPELALDQVQGTSEKLFKASSSNKSDSILGDQHLALLQQMSQERSDMVGLPLQLGDACKTNAEVAKLRSAFARSFRQVTDRDVFALLVRRQKMDVEAAAIDDYLARTEGGASSIEEYIAKKLDKQVAWKNAQQVPILEQVLQAGAVEYRRLLVHLLEQIEGREASEALARRVVFDLDESVRAAAKSALASRERDEYSHVFERADRFPLAATTHTSAAVRQACAAAEAAGGPQPNLTTMPAKLDDFACVSRPYAQPCGTWVVDELVKVNHLRNCTLCHPASTSSSDPLRGPIPQPGQALPRVYYSESRGNFVRADIVYIRQDFSVLLPVENADPWPKLQRYDFFVRTRPAYGVELATENARRNRAQAIIDQVAAAFSAEIAKWHNCMAPLQQEID